MMTLEEKISAAESNLSRQLEWHSRFDSRTLLVLGIDTGMLGYVASMLSAVDYWGGASIFFSAVTAGLLAASFLAIFRANQPDTRAPSGSALFFGTIASMKLSDFRSTWDGLDHATYLQDLNEQVHRNAEIITAKFRHLRMAMNFLVYAIIPWLVTVVLLHAATGESNAPECNCVPTTTSTAPAAP